MEARMFEVANLEENIEVASQNHSLVQARLCVQLFLSLGEKFNSATELSLDMSSPERQALLEKHRLDKTRELKPDLVLYHAKDLGFIKISQGRDKVRVPEPPLLCVEIVSPTQGAQEILDKFRVYFEIGVKSCWYVDPALETVHVYDESLENEVYHNTDLVDQSLGIKIPLNKIFF
jgi:Uma2 family endonuclease